MDDCYYFGCWGSPGHFLYGPGGVRRFYDERVEWYGKGAARCHLDGSLAPRRVRDDGAVVWSGNGTNSEDLITYASKECPQGQFLRHELDNGFTAIQWWDRTQGDTRGACNSTVLLRGSHTSEEMLAALTRHFPEVLERLTKAGVSLVEVVWNAGKEPQ